MSASEKLVKAFAEGLQIKPDQVVDALKYQEIRQWDSVGHMAMIAALEAEFDIMLDTDDIIDMSSVGKAKEILAKYEIGPF
jgi:acyl carrier protein